MNRETYMYIDELKRRIKALSKFKAPAFREEKVMLEGKLEYLMMKVKA